jgi:hypothetical protein
MKRLQQRVNELRDPMEQRNRLVATTDFRQRFGQLLILTDEIVYRGVTPRCIAEIFGGFVCVLSCVDGSTFETLLERHRDIADCPDCSGLPYECATHGEEWCRTRVVDQSVFSWSLSDWQDYYRGRVSRSTQHETELVRRVSDLFTCEKPLDYERTICIVFEQILRCANHYYISLDREMDRLP